MPRWGHFDFDELKRIAKNLEEMEKALPGFIEECVRELAMRLLAKVVLRTPVGQYGDHWVEFTTKEGKHVKFFAKDNRQGGTLRKGWTIGQVKKTANGYEVEVINPVYYASYVEYGHRTRDHKGWVEGRFMLTISEKELKRELPVILKRKQEAFLKKYLE